MKCLHESQFKSGYRFEDGSVLNQIYRALGPEAAYHFCGLLAKGDGATMQIRLSPRLRTKILVQNASRQTKSAGNSNVTVRLRIRNRYKTHGRNSLCEREREVPQTN